MILAMLLSLAVHAQPPLCSPQGGARLSPNTPYDANAAARGGSPQKARQISQCPENEALADVENKAGNVRVQSGREAPARLTPIDLSQARSIFQRLKNDARYSFANPVDGCFARSHLVAAELQREGVASAKVWLHEARGRRLRVERDGRRFEWEFHVANLIAVKKNGCVELMVLDPGVADEPVTIEQWRAAQIKHAPDQATRLQISSRFDYEQGSGRANWNCTHFAAAREANEQFLTPAAGTAPAPSVPGKGGVSRWLLMGSLVHAAEENVYSFEGVITRLESKAELIEILVKGRAAYYRLAPDHARTLQRLRDAHAEGKTVRFTVRQASAQVTAVQVLP